MRTARTTRSSARRPAAGASSSTSPRGGRRTRRTNTYDGQAGVPVGGLFNKLMYAIKFSEPNIVLSSRVNQNSRILYDRAPRERVQKVAPWLTVDGDAYPAVVDGRVKWILDGYTTTDHYPNSEKDSLRVHDVGRAEPEHDVRHAADRRDQLHAQLGQGRRRRVRRQRRRSTQWDDKDPILKAWEGAFPGTRGAEVHDPAGPAGAHALPRGPVQGAAQHAARRTTSRTRRRSTAAATSGRCPRTRRTRPTSSRRTGSRCARRPAARPGVLPDQRVRAATSGRTSRRSSPWTPTPARRTTAR